MSQESWFYRPVPPSPDHAPDRPATPQAAATRLADGNRRFVADAADCPCDVVPRQAPHSIVLGCSDARVPAELVFDAGPNELFVVRVAGNVLGDECLGSIEYALYHFEESVRLLVVVGHTGCGADRKSVV